VKKSGDWKKEKKGENTRWTVAGVGEVNIKKVPRTRQCLSRSTRGKEERGDEKELMQIRGKEKKGTVHYRAVNKAGRRREGDHSFRVSESSRCHLKGENVRVWKKVWKKMGVEKKDVRDHEETEKMRKREGRTEKKEDQGRAKGW